MVQACVEEGALEFEVKGKRKRGQLRKTLKMQVEKERECWFEEEECIESKKMESGSWRDCCQSEVNPATPVYGNKPGSKKKLELEIADSC